MWPGEKKVRNTTGSTLLHERSGLRFKDAIYTEINPDFLYFYKNNYDDGQLWGWINDGSLIFNDGTQDYLEPYEAYHRLVDSAFGIPFLGITNSNRPNGFVSEWVQPAIEEGQGAALGNDLDSMQFGISTLKTQEDFLFNIFQISSDESPTNLAYNVLFRRLSFFNNVDSGSFEIYVYKMKPNLKPSVPANQVLIYTETFNGYSGYTPTDQNISVEAGWGIGIAGKSLTGAKPSSLNVTVWSRQV